MCPLLILMITFLSQSVLATTPLRLFVLDGECGNLKESICSDVCETDEEENQVEELVDRIYAWV